MRAPTTGVWLLRIEDLDPPREEPDAADSFPRDLEILGLCWDGDVTRQSDRLALYDDALRQLVDKGLAYRCACSRRDIETSLATTRVCRSRLSRHLPENASRSSTRTFAYRLNIAACEYLQSGYIRRSRSWVLKARMLLIKPATSY